MDNNDHSLWYSLVAFIGGIAKEMQNYLDNKHVTLWTILARGFVAGFSGVMLATTLYHFSNNQHLSMIGAGVGGWMGPGALQFLQYLLKKNFDYAKK